MAFFAVLDVSLHRHFLHQLELKDSNEAKVMAILEALRIYSQAFQESLIVESDTSTKISRGCQQSWRALEIPIIS